MLAYFPAAGRVRLPMGGGASAAIIGSMSMIPREVEERTGVRLCTLQYLADRIERCPGADCPFWEEGGAAVEPGCIIDRLALDLESRPELVHALLQVRRRVWQAVTTEDADAARSLFYRLLPGARADD